MCLTPRDNMHNWWKEVQQMENTKIMQDFIPSQEFKRVAAYCRVSTNSDEQLKSLAAQREHY